IPHGAETTATRLAVGCATMVSAAWRKASARLLSCYLKMSTRLKRGAQPCRNGNGGDSFTRYRTCAAGARPRHTTVNRPLITEWKPSPLGDVLLAARKHCQRIKPRRYG